MEVLFLGTAAAEGIPALFCKCETCLRAGLAGGHDIRSRCGFLINRHLMLDMTPDIMLHKLRYNLDLTAVDAVCFTHSHTDHLAWAELTFRGSPYAYIPGGPPLAVYANKKSCFVIREGLKFEFGVPEDPSLEIHEIAPGSVIQRGELRVTALKARHDPREDCLFFLLEEGERAFLQMNDTGLPEEDLERVLAEALRGRKLDAVSMDCTTGREKGSAGHMGMGENIFLKKRLLDAGLASGKTRFISNHFSHNGHVSHGELCEVLGAQGIVPAYDGMILEI
ncbi:MAG: hypothetical protein LBT95_01450 [Treponema sp.]|nr:hypothetical protein [Treponema sp.]